MSVRFVGPASHACPSLLLHSIILLCCRIFAATAADMETARRMSAEQPSKATSNSTAGSNGSSGSQRAKQSANLHIIRLRGLPFSATPADIKAFLAPVELPDGINSIQMVRHPDLRPTGEAYVHLHTETEVMQALNKHKQMMGKRYIEVRHAPQGCRVRSAHSLVSHACT